MPWKKQTGSSGQGSWGGGRPPDLESILRRSRAQMRRTLLGGFGSGRIGIALWLAGATPEAPSGLRPVGDDR